MEIWPPIGFSEIGQRAVNQDYLYPKPEAANLNHKLFIACDGIGGLDKGEIASEILATIISEIFFDNTPVNPVDLKRGIEKAINQFNIFLAENLASSRMGSTLALVQIQQDFAVVAHIGDSRVYHFRNGKILYQSTDHKKITELIQAGLITEEQAKTHPWRNKLSKAVVSDIDLDIVQNLADIKIIDDIQPKDIFFICTDGILEKNTNELFCKLVAEFEPPEIIDRIKDNSKSVTKDNYSCYLIKIKSVN